jgi:GTPase SAR1 family protein
MYLVKVTNKLNFLVIIVGEPSVGKTSLLTKYVKGIFPKNPANTVALEFCTKIITLRDGSNVKVQLFDTGIF